MKRVTVNTIVSDNTELEPNSDVIVVRERIEREANDVTPPAVNI